MRIAPGVVVGNARPLLVERFETTREQAREWLAKRDFSQLLGDFFLEETAANKAARISALGCEVFVDDLWEFLERPDFPVGARKIWFDPSGSDQARPGLERLGGWPAAESLVFG